MELRPCTIEYIDLHHTAGHEDNTQAVREYHVNVRGYGDIGYNAVIELNGTVGTGRDIKWSGAHDPAKAPDGSGYTMNQRAYAISHIGDFMKDIMTDVQFWASVKHCVQKCIQFGITPSKATIRRHKDQYATDCPGDNFPYDKYVCEVIKLFNQGDDLHMNRVVLLNTPEPKDMILVKEYFDYTSPCPILFRVNGQPPEEAFKADELIILGGSDVPSHPNRKLLSGQSWFGTVAKVGQDLGRL